MKVRQDAWTAEDDLLLAETVLRHVREGSTQLNAFEEVGDKLNRTSAACGFRWNAVVRHTYEKALQLAKKQRKQRQRMLGKEQGGKKKLLYTPPIEVQPELADNSPVMEMEISNELGQPADGESTTFDLEKMVEELNGKPAAVQSQSSRFSSSLSSGFGMQPAPQGMTMQAVIAFLQNYDNSSVHAEALKSENERLKREVANLRRQNEEMENKIRDLEQNTGVIQEDYETLLKIMNKARNLVLFEEEDRPTTKFKMDRNGNLEKIAE
ncbi:Prespore-specific transcriptional regulator RsfA [Neobacillus piezotolerans]|uniref:Prespore-specific transcriptional regulator RsfA n=1 Tax=Neobacillus piezotolerans TaxID=2259171 RepID=A0A3D8GU01_9BACI|nr:RsfA family transcriptional regulator [Neobacillus piezotolerans]RDU37954.1 Prespore-specific transcriptional regulator RsfA [Neobacillus piezotolerans]